MKNRIVLPKDEWSINVSEFLKKFRQDNPYYPIDPFQRVCEKRMEFITDDNRHHQHKITKEAIANFGEPPF